MRILHMTTEFPPVVFGGLGTAVGGLVHALASAGDTLGVLLVGGSSAAGGYGAPAAEADLSPETGEGINFFQVPWAAPAEEAARIAREWRPDVVHLHTAWIWPVAEAVLAAGVPVVYTAHSVDRAEYEIGMEPGHILEHSDDQGLAIASVDRLIALTRDEADDSLHGSFGVCRGCRCGDRRHVDGFKSVLLESQASEGERRDLIVAVAVRPVRPVRIHFQNPDIGDPSAAWFTRAAVKHECARWRRCQGGARNSRDGTRLVSRRDTTEA